MYGPRTKSTVPTWCHGLRLMLKSWDDFKEEFNAFQTKTFQRFTKRTTTSVVARNKQMVALATKRKRAGKKSRKDLLLIPEEWKIYSSTLVCTHGQPYEPKGRGKRKHNKIRDTKGKARVNVRATVTLSGEWYLRVNASGYHNHALNKHVFDNYAENRKVTDSLLTLDVVILRKAGANARGILNYLREQTGKKPTLRDVHNMLQRHKLEQEAGLTDAQRSFAVLDEFSRKNEGNAAKVLVDSETNVARIAIFQTARMKRLFKAFPDVVLVDSTHDTNVNRYKLFSFVVHDVFGKGQYVHHALVDTEEKDNLRRVVEIFKANDPDWPKIRLFMTDKAIHEKQVLLEEFPDARQLLCQWHVITWLKKQATRLAPDVKADAKSIVRQLVYARSSQEYEDARRALLGILGNDANHLFYKTFMDNWDTSQDEWVAYLRDDVPHLTNNTNNRIESKWGEIKNVIKASVTVDQLLSTLITLQEYAEDQYLAGFHRVGSRPHRYHEDPELTRLALQLSPFAFKLVSTEHAAATSLEADYTIDLHESGVTRVTSSRSGHVHAVDTKMCSCDCTFMTTCLLPCRHVMLVRSTSNYETAVPPMRFFATRWIVHSPENNIDAGEVTAGGLDQRSCSPRSKLRPLSGSTMYSTTKAPMEKIVDRMGLQTTPTFRVALKWLQEFYSALEDGDVVDFATKENCTGEDHAQTFPGLSQISSVEGARLSQMSFGDPSSQVENDAAGSDERSPGEGERTVTTETTVVDEEKEVIQEVAVQKSASAVERPKTAQKADDAAGERAQAVTWSFAKRPMINGMTKPQRKQAQARADAARARELAVLFRKGKMPRFVNFDEVAALLNGLYSFYYSKGMVDALVIPNVDVQGELSVKPLAVGQDMPQITRIPPLPVIMSAIAAIKKKNNIDLLAFWPDYGYATFDQLDAMDTLVEARARFILVMRTTKWIDEVEWRVAHVRDSFYDMTHATKAEHKGYVETLNLSVNKIPGEVVSGYQLLDFRDNLWLHTTSILVFMMVLRATYPGVGIINPSYHSFAAADQRQRVANGFGASAPRNERVIGILNISGHWVAFLVDRNISTDTNMATCWMFDPLQSPQNYSIIEKSVRSTIEEVLQLKDRVQYDKVKWCTQKDSSSCGVWCVSVLEMLLSKATWDDCLYNLQPYLRMLFLHKAIAFVEKEAALQQL